MSWPKAFVRFPDKPKPMDFRRVTVLAYIERGRYIRDGKAVNRPVLAVEAYFPDGRPDDHDWEKQLTYQNLFVPLEDVVSLNCEAVDYLNSTYGLKKKWLREQGIRLFADGYGADQKENT